jgi:hypothetical protein
MIARMICLVSLVLLAACGGGKPEKSSAQPGDTLTERQRDSILAGSRIPGARGVGAAMRAADSTSAGVRATDTISP